MIYLEIMKWAKTIFWTYSLLFFLVPFLFYPNNFELFEFNKMMAVYALTAIIVALWLCRMAEERKFIFRRTFLDLPLLIFLLSQVASFYFSIDRHMSLWGYYSRFNGGLLSIISYVLLYWAYVSNFAKDSEPNAKNQAKNKTDSKESLLSRETITHLKLLIFSGILISLYGVLEHFGVSPSCAVIYKQFDDACWVQDVKTRVFATLGQPNWLAAWIAAVAPISWYSLFKSKSKILSFKFWAWAIVSVLFLLVTIYTKSRSGLLAFATADLVFWGITFLSQRKSWQSLLAPFLSLNILFLVVIALSGTPWTQSIFDLIHPKVSSTPVAQEAPALEGGGTETGAIRKIVWKGALDIGLAHPLFGTGVETFAESYYQFRPQEHNTVSEWDFLYNKAHNEFLNYLATTGFFGLGAYLLLIGSVIFWSIKSVVKSSFDPLLAASALSAYLSILVTNFFGFSVVVVQILFFLFPAMVALNQGKVVNSENLDKLIRAIPKRAAQVLVLVILLIILSNLSHLWQADTHYSKANQLLSNGQPQTAFLEARQAVSLSPNEPTFKDILAQTASSLAVLAQRQDEATLSAELASLASQESTLATTISPYSLQFWTSRAFIFSSLAEADPQNATQNLNLALDAMTKATTLAPTHPKMFYNQALVYIKLGQIDKAKEALNKAISLKSDYKDPRLVLAILLSQEKNTPSALEQANYIITNIDPTDKDVQALVASWSAKRTK